MMVVGTDLWDDGDTTDLWKMMMVGTDLRDDGGATDLKDDGEYRPTGLMWWYRPVG